MDHLVCFMPGLLALGATCQACMLRTPESIRMKHMELAKVGPPFLHSCDTVRVWL
jgi:hypothetical protein